MDLDPIDRQLLLCSRLYERLLAGVQAIYEHKGNVACVERNGDMAESAAALDSIVQSISDANEVLQEHMELVTE